MKYIRFVLFSMNLEFPTGLYFIGFGKDAASLAASIALSSEADFPK